MVSLTEKERAVLTTYADQRRKAAAEDGLYLVYSHAVADGVRRFCEDLDDLTLAKAMMGVALTFTKGGLGGATEEYAKISLLLAFAAADLAGGELEVK